MDLGSVTVGSNPHAAVRADVLSWLERAWDPTLSLVQWRERLVQSGWAAPSWPRRWHGRDLPRWADGVARSAIISAGAVATPVGSGMTLAAPTILEHGPDHTRDRFLRPALTGVETWCQLFSEPGAGSDLAGVTTTAELDGDEWRVNGQKVWTTSAHHADLGMLVVRTDWGVPKHRGLTYLVLPMNQPGVEVRPLRQMNGHASFNEVFLTDARVPRDWVVGEVGRGWAAALTTLAHERSFAAMGRPRYATSPQRTLAEARTEADVHFEPYRWYPQRAGRADLVLDHLRTAGRADHPVLRQAAAAVESASRIGAWTADRSRAALALGRPPGPEGSIGKLALSALARRCADVHGSAAGAHGMLAGSDGPFGGTISEILVSVPAQSIAGGTDEIQRNILGERALGLPREPSIDRERPFRDVPRTA